MTSLDVRNLTRRPAPRFAYANIAAAVLPGWEVSLAFAGSARAKSMNMKLRGKEYVPNVLSYESGKKSGEIVICLDVAKKQAPDYGMSYPHFVAYLFIHGLLHLKGQRHGITMEVKERALMARFINSSRTSNGSTNRRRNRSRNSTDESRHR